MRRTMVLGVLSLGLLAGSTVVATAAAAAPPEIVFLEDQGLFGLPNLNCDGFDLIYTPVDERATQITYFDREGNPSRIRITFQVKGLLTNSVTGETFRDHAAGVLEFNLLTGTISISDLSFNYHSPGEGVLFLEAGRRVVDANGDLVFSAGPIDFVEEGFDGICAALG